jgi:hypothetical protein
MGEICSACRGENAYNIGIEKGQEKRFNTPVGIIKIPVK